MTTRKKWTENELLIALNLYHKLTFGQFDQRNPVVIALAKKFERTPSSVAMKLSNLASLDPVLKMRGIKGLDGASALDRHVWNEFHENLAESVPANEEALRQLFEAAENTDLEVLPREGIHLRKRPAIEITEVSATIKVRRGQEYFRNAVLNNFAGVCGVTQLGIRELLIASHILPWGTHPSERLNVRNGLCLSRLHDAAFDRGLITFDADLKLILSPKLKAELPQRSLTDNFVNYEGKSLNLHGEAILPDPEFLAHHRAEIFLQA